MTGDGVADLIVTGDDLLGLANGVTISSGAGLIAGKFPGFGAIPIASFCNAVQPGSALVSMAMANADGDKMADLAVGGGARQESQVKLYLGKNLAGMAEPASASADPFGTIITGGGFVG